MPEAVEAVRNELQNFLTKGVFDPSEVRDWTSVRADDPSATIGSGMMILGRKNAEREEAHWAYKVRLVFQGNRVVAATGERVFGTPDDLYGKPVDLALARTIIATALLRDWTVEAGDIDGAYLTAPLRGPPVYMRVPAALWAALGVSGDALRARKNPRVLLRMELRGHPRSGFDSLASFDGVLTDRLGWS